jgi:hypothetical protein
MSEGGSGVLGTVSAVAGFLALVGHCACCIPIVNYIAPFLVILLEIVAIVTGFVARSQSGGTDSMANVGLASGALAALTSLAFIAVYVLAIFGVVGLSVLGAATGN